MALVGTPAALTLCGPARLLARLGDRPAIEVSGARHVSQRAPDDRVDWKLLFAVSSFADRVLDFGLPLVQAGFWVEYIHCAHYSLDAREFSCSARDRSGGCGGVLPRSVRIEGALRHHRHPAKELVAVFHHIFSVAGVGSIGVGIELSQYLPVKYTTFGRLSEGQRSTPRVAGSRHLHHRHRVGTPIYQRTEKHRSQWPARWRSNVRANAARIPTAPARRRPRPRPATCCARRR